MCEPDEGLGQFAMYYLGLGQANLFSYVLEVLLWLGILFMRYSIHYYFITKCFT